MSEQKQSTAELRGAAFERIAQVYRSFIQLQRSLSYNDPIEFAGKINDDEITDLIEKISACSQTIARVMSRDISRHSQAERINGR